MKVMVDPSENNESAQHDVDALRQDDTGSRRVGALVFYAAVIGGMVVALRAMGRNWWCNCGSYMPWSWDVWSSHNSQHLIDPYFFTHVLHGVLFYWALSLALPRLKKSVRFRIAIVIEAGWELLENSPMIIERYRTATISLDYFGDSIANSVFDVIACALGFLIASSLRWYWSLLLIVVVEIALLLTIRDSLAVNVIMLVYPIEAIKTWQGS
ncbi:MAG: DUF2585 family protein [Rubripirellula sp.]